MKNYKSYVGKALVAAAFALTPYCALAEATYPLPATPAVSPASAMAEKTIEVNQAAKVALAEGDVTVLNPAKQKRKVAVGDQINEGDSIVTGKDGELHLDMEDGGYISVRPNTKMRITKYQAKGEASDTGIFGLLEGSFRSVTGWIGKFNRNNYVVRTPTATIGIRGTDHEPSVIAKGSSEGEAGTYDKVNEGGSIIQTAGGRAEVAPNQAGFVGNGPAAKPRVLKEIPAHFRAGRHERLFIGKHAEIQSRIEKRREERRQEIGRRITDKKAEAEKRREARQQAIREKRESVLKQREEAKQAKQAKKIDKQEKLEAKEAETDHIKGAKKLHPHKQ